MTPYDAIRDATAGYALWVRYRRHELLLAGDAFGGEDERVDLFVLLCIARAGR